MLARLYRQWGHSRGLSKVTSLAATTRARRHAACTWSVPACQQAVRGVEQWHSFAALGVASGGQPARWRGCSSMAGGVACQKCGAVEQETNFFCNQCNRILPVGTGKQAQPDHFTLLGVEKRYAVDLNAVEARFKDLQRLLHPDKFATASEEEKLWSDEHSARLNKAVSTLRSPLERALYMLETQGIEMAEGTVEDPALLMEIMETRMEVDEAESEQELLPLRDQNRALMDESELELAKAFEAADLHAAKQQTIRLTYLCRIHEVITAKL